MENVLARRNPNRKSTIRDGMERNSPHFMEQPESSLPYSQAPATYPYPEPTPSSPHNPFPLPEDPS
jgi:hypothetical protein